MTITHKLSIDLLRQDQSLRIDAVQNDCGRVLALMLHANGIPWPVPEETSALVRYRKSDGIGGEYDTLPDGNSAWSMEGNVLTVALVPQVLTTAGETILSVQLTNGDATIHTFDITLQVHPNLRDSIVKSETYIHCASGEDALKDIGAKIISGKISSIVLLGDSITDGAGGSDYNGSYTGELSTNTKGYCWANVFTHFTRIRYGTNVRNAGMHGTGMAAQKKAALELITKDDFVIWLTGTFDRNQPEAYESALRSNLAAVREKCAGMLVISSLSASRTDENAHTVNMQKMDEIVTKTVSGYIPHISMYQEFFRFCELHTIGFNDTLADSVHPNDLGHFIMFKILCDKLGLPLDPFVDHQYGSAWWEEAVKSVDECACGSDNHVLITNTDTRDESQCTGGVSLSGNFVPCSIMTGYDADSATTSLSGKHIARAELYVYQAGEITFGTVDLTQIGAAPPVCLNAKQITVEQTGVVDIPIHINVGPQETLVVHSTDDTGKLGFFTAEAGTDDDLQFWKPTAFLGTDEPGNFFLFGTIYGE